MLKRAAIGSFDSFNPFIVKGQPAAGVAALLFDTLLTPSQDEADASYGLLAQSIELPDDHSWVAFNLRPEARFQDGTPVTAEDVVFTFDMLTTKGDPQYALYYGDVTKAEAVGAAEGQVHLQIQRQSRAAGDPGPAARPVQSMTGRARPSIRRRSFPPVGSGPYKVDSFEVGRYVTYKLDPNYWGAKLPVNVGTNNWGVQRFDYYKDQNVALDRLPGRRL